MPSGWICHNCNCDLNDARVGNHCPVCGSPVRPPASALAQSEASRYAFYYGLLAIGSYLLCLGPVACVLAIPAFAYAKTAEQEYRQGLIKLAGVKRARIGRRLAWVSIALFFVWLINLTLLIIIRSV